MKKEEIVNEICKIANMVHPQKDVYINNNFDKKLTGDVMNLSAIDLVYLLYYIECEFSITIYGEELQNYQFNSINNIADLVEEKIK